jgi:peptidoglycan/LPS O-acetylase OafA/YrhL
MLAIGAAAGAASFTHVHNVAASHGQPGWLAWADAIVLELMSIASGLELRRRRREHTSTRLPAVVLGCAVVLSLAAQVVEAEPSPIGWTAAAIPALGFLVMVKVALSHAGGPSGPAPSTLDDTSLRAESGDRPAAQPAAAAQTSRPQAHASDPIAALT